MAGPGTTACPRCGFEQPPAEECARCGVVFRKAHGTPPTHHAPAPQHAASGSGSPRSPFHLAAFLAVSGALAMFLLHRPSPARPSAGASPARAAHDGWYEGASGYAKAEEDHRAGRPMVVYFHTDWCGWCKKLDADYLETPEVRAYFAGVARVRVNPDHGDEEVALARRYGVRGYPTFLVVPAGGGDPVRIHPFSSDGQMSTADFVAACRAAG